MTRFIRTLPLLFAVTLAHAADISESRYANGVCEPGASSRDAVDCAYKKYKLVEVILNDKYKQLHSTLDAFAEKYGKYSEASRKKYTDLKHLHTVSQRAWITFRENECRAVETWYRGGKLQKALYYDCMRSMAERRIEEFEGFTRHQT